MKVPESGATMIRLTPDQVASYNRDGFILVEDVFPHSELDSINREIDRLRETAVDRDDEAAELDPRFLTLQDMLRQDLDATDEGDDVYRSVALGLPARGENLRRCNYAALIVSSIKSEKGCGRCEKQF